MPPFVNDVRAQLYQWQQSDLATALITLINYEGSSPRPMGSQLIVNSQGEYHGLISGGCLETALIHEAQECIQSGTPRIIRYGKDSDYLDIQLPCGSGIDVLIIPKPKKSWVRELYQAFEERRAIAWQIDLNTGEASTNLLSSNDGEIGRGERNQQLSRQELKATYSAFKKVYLPRIQLHVMGNGAIFDYFNCMAALFDIELITHQTGSFKGSEIRLHELDKWSAFITLSHDHQWEEEALNQVLSSEAFYIAALGSKATQKKRRQRLKALGRTQTDIARIKGPAGLDLGGQTPPEIALSILSELVGTMNKSPIMRLS